MKFKKVFAILMLAMVLSFSFSACAAYASTGGAETFGFEGVIEKFTNTLQGPTAQYIAIAAIVICALALIFQPDMQAWMKMLVAIVLIAACCAKAANIVKAIGLNGSII